MTIFCLNIIIYNEYSNSQNIDMIIDLFKSQIKFCRIINFSKKEFAEPFCKYFNEQNINVTIINDSFICYKDLLDKIVKSKIPHDENNNKDDSTVDSKSEDLMNILIDSDQLITCESFDMNYDLNQCYYVDHTENYFNYPKLFVFNNNINLDTTPLISFSCLPENNILINNLKSVLAVTERAFLQNKYTSICESIDKNSYSENNYTELPFFYYIIKNFDKTIEFCTKIKIGDKWFINYLLAVSYLNNQNYRKSIEHANICISINPSMLEPVYIISKIHYTNKQYEDANKVLSKIPIENLRYNVNVFSEIEIYTFFIHCQNVLVNKSLENIHKSVNICDFLLLNTINVTYYNIINHILYSILTPISTEDIKYNDFTMFRNRNNGLVNDITCVHMLSNKEELQLTYNTDDNNLSFKNSSQTNTIYDIKLNNFSSLMHNTEVIIISSIYPEFKLQKLNILDAELSDFKSYSIAWNNIKIVTKFVQIENIYIGIVNNIKSSIYRFLYLDSNTLKPLAISNCFKLRYKTDIIDIETVNNEHINIFTKNNTIDTISICTLYFMFNAPISYNENIKIEISKNIELGLKTYGYDIPNHNYKNYVLSNNKKDIIVQYDFNINMVKMKDISYNKLIQEFIFLPTNCTLSNKEFDICYYDITTIENDLITKLSDNGFTTCDTYNSSKYLIINNNELENLPPLKLSNIIESKTLIISLINEADLENSNYSTVYSHNEYLNKLFLFNIVKNAEYINFIIEKIIKNQEYDKRSEFMSIDIERIYDNCNIYTHYFMMMKESKKRIAEYERELSKDKYKEYILIKASQNIVDNNIIEILKFIILNKQDIDIFYNVNEIPPMIELLNIFSETLYLKNIDNPKELGPIKCILYLNNVEDIIKYRCICDANSLIYCVKDNIIYYT